MKTSLNHILLSICAGLFLFSVDAIAEEKKEELETIQAMRTTAISFENQDQFQIFISGLPLSTKQSGAKKLASSVQVYCRRTDLEGAHQQSNKFDFGKINPVDDLVPCNESRFTAGEGATIIVYYLDLPENEKPSTGASSSTNGKSYCAKQKTLPSLANIIETSRTTLLSLQIKQLAQFILKNKLELLGTEETASRLKVESEETSDKICAWNWNEYSLTTSRATVQFNTLDPIKTDKALSFNVITGSPEHFFLSVDALFKDVKQLSAAAKNKDAVKEKPERVFLSMNYMFGDVYATLPSINPRRFVLKFMTTPNQQFDSYGFGLGYRLSGNTFSMSTTDSENHSGLVLFVGRFWTRPAKSPLDVPSTDARRVASTSFGISYSLGAALDWLKPTK